MESLGFSRDRRPERNRRSRQHGFTLIELLVVMLIIGIALATVSINGMPGSREGLRYETERLAQLLLLAREEAQVRGAPIRLEVDELRYRFAILQRGQWEPVLDDADLRERRWEGPTRLRIQKADGDVAIVFGRDAVDVPFMLTLARDGASNVILSNGLGTFEVQ
ncbi:MAG TPA: GspH/FimT family pseudopilin [Burkholderiaceae bacterium]|nr:GspH/FimT family pseudopilin [Burkholderiaceae bacterium]